jgi:hypothetical protein
VTSLGGERRRSIALAAVCAIVAGLVAVAVVAPPARAAAQRVIRVPQDRPTIQAAVNAASPGTLVLVSPGVYHEAVTIGRAHRNIVVRGVNRETTILDGGFDDTSGRENGFRVHADGVAIENLTARNFIANGFLWSGVDGYRGSYLTAIRNGDYGIYAFDSVHGQLDHSFAQGSPDAGFYIGQCYPCHALITDVEAEWNGLGYSGSNSGGDLLIARSSFHDNRAGIVPNSDSSEELAPQRRTAIIGNHVANNNNTRTAAIEIAQVAIGNGILVGGGNENTIERNLVTGHDISGIAVVPRPEKILAPGDPKAHDYDARDNTVKDNEVASNQYDLASVTNITDATDGGGNCFSGNRYTTSTPADIEQVLPCGSAVSGFHADIALFASLLGGDKPTAVDYRDAALPDLPALANMPRARTAPARPAVHEPSITLDPSSLHVPTGA